MAQRWIVRGALAMALTAAGCESGAGDDTERPVWPVTGGTGGFAGSIPLEQAGSDSCFGAPGGLKAHPGPSTPAGMMAFGETSRHFFDPVATLEKAPPPISGGTLLASSDRSQLIAADPDRDAVYLIDVATRALTRKIELNAGDEPGRAVQDKTGRVHVALRGGRSLASFALGADAAVTRTEVCDLPRGLAYDAASDRVWVACADGALVSFDPATNTATRKADLGRDLRDVAIRGDRLLVSRFRTAEVLEVSANDGRVLSTKRPPVGMERQSVVVDEVITTGDGCQVPSTRHEERNNELQPNIAWRMIDVPNRGLAMLHQRAGKGEVQVSQGGYGGGSFSCVPGITRNAVTIGDDALASADLAVPGLFVDIAVDPTATMLAIANPGGWGTQTGVLVMHIPGSNYDPRNGSHGSCMPPSAVTAIEGQATAVTFVSEWMVAVQEREPAGITFYDIRPGGTTQRLDLAQPSRSDSGHTMFHLSTGSGIACASCHAEAGDDAHVWTFHEIGPRRTQSLRGGILGSEPFHWNGDMSNFEMLVREVFVGRMSAPEPSAPQATALAAWIDRQPVLHAKVQDEAAATRGQALFTSEAVGCGKCHNGARLSNNETHDVGTGAKLQVPSLRGVSFRTPIMHDGCAATLNDRFNTCGGGDAHGRTSQLKPNEVADLVAYLESL